MNTKQTVINILLGSAILGLANAYLYTFDGLSFLEAFAGYTVLAFVVLMFLVSFIPSRTTKEARPSKQKKFEKPKAKPVRQQKKHNTPAPVEEPQESSGADDDRLSGHIKWYDPRKGFGFLVYDDKEIFFHRHAIRTRHHHFQEDDPIVFLLGESDKGPQATALWFDKN